MTPKEKAKSLLSNFKSKELSNIVVDEIINNFEGLSKPEYTLFDSIGERKFTYDGEYEGAMSGYDMINYWEEVKKEING